MQPLADKALYQAFKSKDPRFDGRFFVGISSTGIYCRPICRARMPKAENCTFYGTAAAAEQHGYRPCLLCRPELAPGLALVDAADRISRQAASMLAATCGSGQKLSEIAERLGVSERHLRRLFKQKYQVTPSAYLQTCRLLLAKNLLTSTDLPVIDIALAAGFGSVRRFNDAFLQHYRLAPGKLRKRSAAEELPTNVTIQLGYRPPYRWEQLLRFLSQRLIPGVETIREGVYKRTASITAPDTAIVYNGWLEVSNCPEKNVLTLSVSASLLPVLPQVAVKIRRLFDLDCDPAEVYVSLQSLNQLKADLCQPGVRLPGCFDHFELLVRAVLGQQVTIKAARTLAGRLAERYGIPVVAEDEALTWTFPTAERMAQLEGSSESQLGPLGIIKRRARTIVELAAQMVAGSLDFDACVTPEAVIEELKQISGIGDWTAQYIAMRALAWPDAFPAADHGIKKALAPLSVPEITALAENWRPWRAYAVICLWQSL